jgi:hypothetical protein
MMTRTKMHSTKKSDQPGFRIHPNGAVEMLTEREAIAIISRALREAMVEAGWQIRRLH